ncbi:MAG: YeeE/YedE family protein [Alphaproteobacteria bacterium]|nr:YeeE/YedE family protein [Alphaproteobacteria bacterium]
MENFTPGSALAGGALIGLAAVMLMGLTGRIAGISGILGGLLPPAPGESAWRAAFAVGLVGGTLLYRAGGGPLASLQFSATPVTLIAAGLLVGFGTVLGSGCTSGHGVCGIARLSKRSVASVATFMITAALTVYVTRHLLGAG